MKLEVKCAGKYTLAEPCGCLRMGEKSCPGTNKIK